MSNVPPRQGIPYGMPGGRGNGNHGWDGKPIRQADGAQGGQRPPPQQRRPPQSDSERRHAERTAQTLPESFRTRPGPQYEEDMNDYRLASPRSPNWPTHPLDRPQGSPRSPSNFQPPHRQFGDRSPSSPTVPWPPRGDASRGNDMRQAGPRRPPPDRMQPGQQQQRRPGNMPSPQPLPRPGLGGQAVGSVAYADYPGPTQPPMQLQHPVRKPVPVPINTEPNVPSPNSNQPKYVWEGNEFLAPPSPNFNRPVTDSSNYSESSAGPIPDSPAAQSQHEPLEPPPIIPAAQRDSYRQVPQRMPLGPPPSSRRGPSSYYSQASFVSPIVEEAGSRSSYASSNVIGVGVPNYYMEDSPTDEDIPNDAQDGRISRASDHDDSSGLVRQASLGKKAKPSVIPVRRESMPKQQVAKGGIVAQAVTSAGAAGGAFAAGLGSTNNASREPISQPPHRNPTALADPSYDSDGSVSTFDEKAQEAKVAKAGFRREAMTSMEILGSPVLIPPRNQSPVHRTGSPFSPKMSSPLSPNAPQTKSNGAKSPGTPNDVKMTAIIAGLEKGGAIDKDAASGLKSPRAGFGEKAGLRRPPRLNVDAVKEAELRGSLTSLPDLIKRATRLASNLDRGKTASRLGLEWFSAEAKSHPEQIADYRKSGTSLSDILASFPPPGVATPTGNRPHTRATAATDWPEFAPSSQGKRVKRGPDQRSVFDKPTEPKPRRCCGMPLWGFVLLTIVLLALIVAAVVIPIALVVLPKQDATNDGQNTALQACQSKSPCQNGGSSTLAADGSCSCLCTNGFTGSSCTTVSDSACTSVAVAGATNATVGNAIPRLLDAAQNNYSIPLESTKVLAQFSTGDVSCNTENALVTLNGQQSRRLAFRSINNLFVPLADASNPFVPPGSIAEPAATGSVPARVKYFDAEIAGWDDGQSTYAPRPTYVASLERRAATSDDAFLSASVTSGSGQTVNGIIVATGAPTNAGSAPSSTSSSSAGLVTASGSPTTTGSAAAASATGATGASLSGTNSQQDMDFARVVILFVLQETGSLASASDAQNRLSTWFTKDDSDTSGSSSAAKDISLGSSGWSIDLVDLQVTLSNGTTYGGQPASTSAGSF